MSNLTELEIKQLEMASNVMWQAMNALIKKYGYSDLTLNLEGSSYEVRDIVDKIKAAREENTYEI